MSEKQTTKPENGDETKLDRRDFLKIVGVAGAASAIPAGAAVAQSHDHMHMAQATMAARPPAAGAATADAPHAWLFLNSDEVAFIEAAVDTLIPSDSVGPGALEAGVAVYIDRQLAGSYGKGDRLYLDGPFAQDAVPQQGYQLPLTPSELIRAGILEVNDYVTATRKNTFAGLSTADRTAVMTELDTNKAKFKTIPVPTFFGLLLQLTNEGYFADPMYGGNRNKAVWKMIGFPGAGAMYVDKIEQYRNKPYTEAPQSIADLS
jgi:gluconate 2-dehydrogenase gamma chain